MSAFLRIAGAKVYKKSVINKFYTYFFLNTSYNSSDAAHERSPQKTSDASNGLLNASDGQLNASDGLLNASDDSCCYISETMYCLSAFPFPGKAVILLL